MFPCACSLLHVFWYNLLTYNAKYSFRNNEKNYYLYGNIISPLLSLQWTEERGWFSSILFLIILALAITLNAEFWLAPSIHTCEGCIPTPATTTSWVGETTRWLPHPRPTAVLLIWCQQWRLHCFVCWVYAVWRVLRGGALSIRGCWVSALLLGIYTLRLSTYVNHNWYYIIIKVILKGSAERKSILEDLSVVGYCVLALFL